MKVIKRQLSDKIQYITLEIIADWHLGSPECNRNEINKQVSRIADNPNMFCILNGDLIDNAIENSVGDVYSQELSPMAQLEVARDTLIPIKDKILCVTGNSNHEGRTYRKTGVNLNALLADSLGLSDYYSDEGVFMFLTLGQLKGYRRSVKIPKPVQYTFYITHGAGGGASVGGKANRLQKLSFISADIIIHSHTHLPLTFKEDFFRVDYANAKVIQTTQLFVNSSAMLNYGGYGENKGYKPSALSCPELWLNGSAKEYRCTI